MAGERLEITQRLDENGDAARGVAMAQVAANARADARPGQRLLVGGKLPARLEGARVRVTLERRVSARPAGLEALPAEGDVGRDAVMQANHDRANNFVLASAEVEAGRDFSARLEVPGELPWRDVIVRVYARKGDAEGMKAAPVPVAGKE